MSDNDLDSWHYTTKFNFLTLKFSLYPRSTPQMILFNTWASLLFEQYLVGDLLESLVLGAMSGGGNSIGCEVDFELLQQSLGSALRLVAGSVVAYDEGQKLNGGGRAVAAHQQLRGAYERIQRR
jgi:curli biogenesis system outer membrane secretion channel CsgG